MTTRRLPAKSWLLTTSTGRPARASITASDRGTWSPLSSKITTRSPHASGLAIASAGPMTPSRSAPGMPGRPGTEIE